MSTPTRDHRPCPKCGATIGRQSDKPAMCHCGTKLRARMVWRVRCRDCDSNISGYVSRGVAAKWARDHKAALKHDTWLIAASCDCGWESEGHVVWVSADDNARYHRQQEHTP